ncbi:hypothetical protein DYB36_004188 [Aphanomyces astaci]|uniref:Matrin-type domain-containing protein n=1 Tax=Aphanomyces astaci TaxID=112090 RepID=A0A397B0X5_APHAT|nr:hypothetical protein DYB36_004188 [Aphanomyces astaci]
MPRYYCDYCDTYLTHDSQAGRKQHNRGWKHRENVKLYYEAMLQGQGATMTRKELLVASPGAWLRPDAARPPGGGAPRPPPMMNMRPPMGMGINPMGMQPPPMMMGMRPPPPMGTSSTFHPSFPSPPR